MPEQPRKVKTFPIWEPSRSDLPADIVQQFLQHQEGLIQLLENHADLVGQNHKIPSPANPNLAYPLDTAFEILVSHEERHLLQARRVKETLEEKGLI